ncbi:MAG: 5-formyltetrahydrofolate cyclo-ligase [Candidatus Zipacnadales bacterium]
MSSRPPDAVAIAKRALRQQILKQRDSLSLAERARRSRAIYHRIVESAEFARARVVLLFASFGSEVDTTALLSYALQTGRRLLLPRVEPNLRKLELREVRSLPMDLAPGTWGILEPLPHRCPELPLEQVDFMLVPGVAFDRELRRLGYGGGYYDRLLAEFRPEATAVGICYDMQLVPEVPTTEHDLRVPLLITETERIEHP